MEREPSPPPRRWARPLTIAGGLVLLASCLAFPVRMAWACATYDADAPWPDDAPEVHAALSEGREPDRAMIERYAGDPLERAGLRVVLGYHHRLDLLAGHDDEISRGEEELARWLAEEGLEVTRMAPTGVVRIREGGATQRLLVLAYVANDSHGRRFMPEAGWIVGIAGPVPGTATSDSPAWSRTHSGLEGWSEDGVRAELRDFASLTDTIAPADGQLELELSPPPPLERADE